MFTFARALKFIGRNGLDLGWTTTGGGLRWPSTNFPFFIENKTIWAIVFENCEVVNVLVKLDASIKPAAIFRMTIKTLTRAAKARLLRLAQNGGLSRSINNTDDAVRRCTNSVRWVDRAGENRSRSGKVFFQAFNQMSPRSLSRFQEKKVVVVGRRHWKCFFLFKAASNHKVIHVDRQKRHSGNVAQKKVLGLRMIIGL